jgi:hypothetical protein
MDEKVAKVPETGVCIAQICLDPLASLWIQIQAGRDTSGHNTEGLGAVLRHAAGVLATGGGVVLAGLTQRGLEGS